VPPSSRYRRSAAADNIPYSRIPPTRDSPISRIWIAWEKKKKPGIGSSRGIAAGFSQSLIRIAANVRRPIGLGPPGNIFLQNLIFLGRNTALPAIRD
jgi:hypothetical protein